MLRFIRNVATLHFYIKDFRFAFPSEHSYASVSLSYYSKYEEIKIKNKYLCFL